MINFLFSLASGGNVFERLKYIKLRLQIVEIILENVILIQNDKSWFEKLKRVNKKNFEIFNEIEELCEFNEIDKPKELEILKIESFIQNLHVSKKSSGISSKIVEILGIRESIEKYGEYSERNNQVYQLSQIVYDILSISSWKKDWKEIIHEENNMSNILSCPLLVAQVLNQVEKKYTKKNFLF